jgi:hypothetical protein
MYKAHKKTRALIAISAVIVLTTIILVSDFLFESVQAQNEVDVAWQEPVLVHATDGSILMPSEIIADSLNRVHIFWSEGSDPEGGSPDNSIYYSRRDNNRWSWAVDILLSPDGGRAVNPVAELSPENVFHLLWRTPTVLFHNTTPAADAESALAWQSPEILFTERPVEYDQLLDSNNVINMSYNVWEDGIYYMAYDVSQGILSNPILIASPISATSTPNTPKISMTQDGVIHIFWTEVLADSNTPIAVYYSRSIDRGLTWSSPRLFYEGNFVAEDIAVTGQDIHVLLLGNASERTRGHIWSADGGNSWSNFHEIVSSRDGAGKSHGGIVIDNDGRVFALFGMRTDTAVGYAIWNGDRWSEPQLLPGLKGEDFQDIRLAIGGGNRLHAMYVDSQQKIWYVEGMTQAEADPTPIATETTSVELVLEQEESIPEPTAPVDVTQELPASFQNMEPIENQDFSLAIAFTASLVFVILVVAIVYLRWR